MRWIDEVLERAAGNGAFDPPRPRSGRIDLTDTGPGWWIRRKLDEERIRASRQQVIDDVERALGGLWRLPTEQDVRRSVDELNARLREAGVTEARLETDGVCRTWRRMVGMRIRGR